MIFVGLQALFSPHCPDTALATFLAGGGELAMSPSRDTLFFKDPCEALDKDATCSLLWWYVHDSFQCGRLLSGEHYGLRSLSPKASHETSDCDVIMEDEALENRVAIDRHVLYVFSPDLHASCVHLRERLASLGVLAKEVGDHHDYILITQKHQESLKAPQVTPFFIARMLDAGQDLRQQMPIQREHVLDEPSPSRPLHPMDARPREGRESLAGCAVSFTGFKGHERCAMETMALLVGLRVSDCLSPHVDLLICHIGNPSDAESAKMRAARTWRIPMVRPDWLLASYEHWQWQPLHEYRVVQ